MSRIDKNPVYHAEALPLDSEAQGDIFLPSLIKTNENRKVKEFFEKIIFAKAKGDNLMASTYFDVLLYELYLYSDANSKK